MQVKGELDINRMPEREAKRILDRIVSAYVRTQCELRRSEKEAYGVLIWQV